MKNLDEGQEGRTGIPYSERSSRLLVPFSEARSENQGIHLRWPLMFNSFRSRLLLSFGGVFALWLMGLSIFFVRGMGAEQFSAQSESLRLSSQMAASMLSEVIKERSTEMDLLRRSPLFVEGDLGSAAIGHALELRRSSQDQYLWLGVADAKGIVRQATGGLLVGESVKERPWFDGAQKGPYAGDVHKAVLLEKRLPQSVSKEPLRFIDFASPIVGKDGHLRGILAAHASWAMVVQAIQLRVLPVLGHEFAEMLILNEDGQIIYPQKFVGVVKAPEFPVEDARVRELVWPDRGVYLTSIASVRNSTQTNLNWRVIIREPIEAVSLRMREFQIQRVTATVASALVLLLFFYGLAVMHSRPLGKLMLLAHSVREKCVGRGELPIDHAQGRGFNQVARVLRELEVLSDRYFQAAQAMDSEIKAKVESQNAVLMSSNVKLTEQVTRDPLTGLANRREFDARLQDAAEQARSGGLPFALLFLDLDHFKNVNDSHGHDVGDKVLGKFGQILLENSRTSDVVARYGGEECVIWVAGADGSQAAIKAAEKIRQAVLATNFPTVGQLTISVGVAVATPRDPAGDAVLKRADQAVYLAKTTGRNKVVFMD